MTPGPLPHPKRLYVFSYYFPPLGRATGVLLTEFVKACSELGWTVSVMTTGSYAPVLFGGQQDASLVEQLPATTRVSRVKDPIGAAAGPFLFASRLWNSQFQGWRLSAVRHLERFHEGHGVVYAHVPPADNLIVAAAFATKYRLPLVLDFKDNCIVLAPEAVRNADYIVASTPISLEHMANHYHFDASRCGILWNGTCGDPSPAAQRPVRQTVNFVFSGTLCPTTRPEVLARAMNVLGRTEPGLAERIQVDFYGPRSYYYYLKLRPHLGPNAAYHGFIPSFQGLLDRLRQADVGVCSFREGWTYGISSKLFTYMAERLPILAYGPDGGALHRFITEHEIGLFSVIGDTQALLANIKRLTLEPELRARFSANMSAIAPRFTMKAQAVELSRTMDALLGGTISP